MAINSTNRAKAVNIRIDKSDPSEVFVPTSQGQWAAFGITAGGGSEIAGLTLDEEEMLSTQTSLLWARSEHESRVRRVALLGSKAKGTASEAKSAMTVVKKVQNDMRASETSAMKAALTGKPTSARVDVSVDLRSDEWLKHEEEERLRTLEMIRKNRRKR